MRCASSAASATTRSAVASSASPTCTSHGLAIARKTPSQPEPRRESVAPAAGSGAEGGLAPAELVAELSNQRVQIRIEIEVRERAHGRARRSVAGLRVVLDARRPFVAARRRLAILEAECDAVELAEPMIGRRVSRQRRACEQHRLVEVRGRLLIEPYVRLQISRRAEVEAVAQLGRVRVDAPVVG